MFNSKLNNKSMAILDPVLLTVFFILLGLGLVMVTSASIVVAQRTFGDPFYHCIHHGVKLVVGLLSGFILVLVPIKVWNKLATPLFFVALFVLACVLVPGIGREVNGSTRWLNLGFGAFQVSEFAKFSVILYLASYMVRHNEKLTETIYGFLKPMALLCVMCVLIILEPDFGSVVVIMATAVGMLFLGGVPWRCFFSLLLAMSSAIAILAVSAPYRLARLTTFIDPWENQFDSGYQLTQSLIAFGRGEWFGVGLGSSVQKLFYLPEAHTDFIFAVIAEELGLVGALCVMGLYAFLVIRGMQIGLMAQKRKEHFGGYLCYGFTLWIGLQAIINIGVNTGVLPTKGLTLPFLSYGGSSVIILCVAMSLMFRIDFENRKYFNKQIRFGK